MGEWLLPVGVSEKKKKKQDQPLGRAGGGHRLCFYQIPKPFNHLTFSESKENICSLRQQPHSAK